MPVTYGSNKKDKRHLGYPPPSSTGSSNPSPKKDSKGDVTKKVGNSSSEKGRMDYSGS